MGTFLFYAIEFILRACCEDHLEGIALNLLTPQFCQRRILNIVTGIVLFLGMIVPSHSFAADDYATLLAEATHSLENFDNSDWAYTETSATSDGTFVGRYDPRLADDKRWALISVDDRAPTDKEREEFITRKPGSEESDEDSDDDTIASMINVETLQLIEETESYWLFDFAPQGGEDEKSFMDNVTGELKITKDYLHLSSIQLRATRPFKPQFGVKISEFLTLMQFGPVGGRQQIAPLSMEFRVKARAFVVKGIDEQSRITFSDYEYVGSPNGAQ